MLNCIEADALEIEYLPLPADYYTMDSFTSVISVSDYPTRSSIDDQSSSDKSYNESTLKRKLTKLMRKLRN
jgi:hypothetical protein